MLESVALPVATVALALSSGSVVFQSFVVAPTLFKTLESGQAGPVLRALFPRFFRVNLALSLVAAAAFAALGADKGWATLTAWGAAGAGGSAAAMAACLAILPATNRAKDSGGSDGARFKRFHLATVLLTFAMLVIDAVLLVRLAARVALAV